jgi:hypothetical protein
VRQFWLGCILLSTAMCSAAASLGRQSGAAVIGQPLDVRVQVALAPGEEPNSLCLAADVMYGDNTLPASAVVVGVQRSAPDAEVSIRVQATRAVDEPVVWVNVRAGCAAPFSRRYVFLADPVAMPQSAGAPNVVVVPVPPSATQPEAVPSDLVSATEGRAPSAEAEPRARLRATSPSTSSTPARERQAGAARPAPPAASVVRRPAPPAAPAPRLQLEPLDLSLDIEKLPSLRLSTTLLSQPAEAEGEREVARRAWAAVNATAEDILRDAQKLAVLEAEVQGLRAEEDRSRATITQLNASLERSRYMDWLVYLLAALLLMVVVALAWILRRQSPATKGAGDAWWTASSEGKAAGRVVEPVVPKAIKGRDKNAGEGVPLDFDLGVQSDFDQLTGDAPQHVARQKSPEGDSIPSVPGRDRRDFSASAIGGGRSVATEELFDVQQQADFFVSLGKEDEAIDVLRNHLAESQEPSPLAYLDLFKLYHRLERGADYEHLRAEFNEMFNAGAPPFEQYSDSSRGLETYETAFSRIQALWGEPRVLDVIEHSIFREAGDAGGEVFDLEAYRELLLLHAVAKEVVKRDASEALLDNNFGHTKVQPLKAVGVAAGVSVIGGERHTEPMDVSPPASPRLGLDIDLDALDAYPEFEASLPEVARPVEPTAQHGAMGDERHAGPASNLIDFELLDFTAPDDGDGPDGRKDKPK